MKDSFWCPYCDESDTITEFLFTCSKVKPFWRGVCDWLRQADELYLDQFATEEYMWGVDGGAQRGALINTLTLLVKYYIYRQKLYYEGDLCLMQWLSELRTRLKTEEWISRKVGANNRFRKWRRILSQLG